MIERITRVDPDSMKPHEALRLFGGANEAEETFSTFHHGPFSKGGKEEKDSSKFLDLLPLEILSPGKQ